MCGTLGASLRSRGLGQDFECDRLCHRGGVGGEDSRDWTLGNVLQHLWQAMDFSFIQLFVYETIIKKNSKKSMRESIEKQREGRRMGCDELEMSGWKKPILPCMKVQKVGRGSESSGRMRERKKKGYRRGRTKGNQKGLWKGPHYKAMWKDLYWNNPWSLCSSCELAFIALAREEVLKGLCLGNPLWLLSDLALHTALSPALHSLTVFLSLPAPCGLSSLLGSLPLRPPRPVYPSRTDFHFPQVHTVHTD